MEPLFDKYSDSYDEAVKKSIGFMGKSHDYYTQAKVDHLLDVLRRQYGNAENLNVLDVGCGVGKTDSFLNGKVKALMGVDVSPCSVDQARSLNPWVQYAAYDGKSLPFGNNSFDAAFLICVMHHVPPSEHRSLLCEVSRVLKPGGALFIFEHNPYNLLTQVAVARCEFDRDAILLTRKKSYTLLKSVGLTVFESSYILFSPFDIKGRKWMEKKIKKFPLGAQYCVAAIKKND
jgi:Methylase involved in ubiquinone/menaquinone biosynthesis